VGELLFLRRSQGFREEHPGGFQPFDSRYVLESLFPGF